MFCSISKVSKWIESNAFKFKRLCVLKCHYLKKKKKNKTRKKNKKIGALVAIALQAIQKDDTIFRIAAGGILICGGVLFMV